MMVILLLVAWLFCAGVAYPFVLNKLVRRCPYGLHFAGKDSDGKRLDRTCREAQRFGAVMLSLFGLVVLPFLLGASITNRGDKEEIRKQKELADAEHAKKLAEIQAETLRTLEKSNGF